MRIRIIRNFKLLPPSYGAITLYPFICFRGPNVDRTVLKHEMIHVMQIRRVGLVSFYISYLLYYLAGLIRYAHHEQAYYNIPYEDEAFRDQWQPLIELELDELGLIEGNS